MKKLLVALVAIVVLLAVGVFVAARMLLDPERIRATVASQATEALGSPVSVGAADVSLWPRAGIALTDVAVGQPASLSLRRVEVSTSMRALLSRRIEDAEVIVADSKVDLPALLATVAKLGDSTPADAANASGPPAVELVNIRTIAFRNVELTSGGRTATVTMESSLAGDRLDVSALQVVTPVTTLSASGAIESLAAHRARLTVTADPLDLDGLMAFSSGAAEPVSGGGGSAGAGDAVPFDVTLDLTAAKGRAAGVAFNNLKATAHLTDKGADLEPFSFGIFGGRLDGAVTAETSGADPVFTVKGTLTGVDMTALTEFAGQKGSVTGTLGGSITLSGAGTDPEAALARAAGSGEVAITNGTMPGLNLVRAVVLAFGRPASEQPQGGGESFSRMGARFALNGGVVRLNDLAFESRDVSVSGAGTLTLAGSALDVKGSAQLSKELTAQAGRDLVRYTAEQGRVTLPATIAGTVSDPSVRIDVGNLAKRAVTNEVQSQMKKQTDSLMNKFLKKKPQ